MKGNETKMGEEKGEGLAYMRIPIPCRRSATGWLVYLPTTNSGWTIRIALLMSPSQASQG